MAHKQQLDEIKKKMQQSDKIISQIRRDIKLTEKDKKERFFMICNDKKSFHPENMWVGTRKIMPVSRELLEKGCTVGNSFGEHHVHPDFHKSSLVTPSISDMVRFFLDMGFEYFPDGGITCISQPSNPDTLCLRLKHTPTEEEVKRVVDIYRNIDEIENVVDVKKYMESSRYMENLFDTIVFRYRKPYTRKK